MRYILNTNLVLKRIILCFKTILWRIKNEAFKTIQVSTAKSIRLPDTKKYAGRDNLVIGQFLNNFLFKSSFG
jgi:hypothetical protein